MFKGERFIIRADEYDRRNGLVHIFDQEDLTCIAYFEEDDGTIKDVNRSLNQLWHDLRAKDKVIADLKMYSDYDTEGMLQEINSWKDKVQKERNLRFLELKFFKNTLDGLISNNSNPEVKEALLEFKRLAEW